jgi:DNA-binding MarR family transcriptional regulator
MPLMDDPRPSFAATMPTLLRQAQQTYSNALRAALAVGGCDDIPASGLFIIGGLARRDAVPIRRLVEALGVSKQGAGQLVDTLVTRGYLERAPDLHDRRQQIVTLTPRGRAAAEMQTTARAALDDALEASVGSAAVETARRTLAALIDLGRPSVEGEQR